MGIEPTTNRGKADRSTSELTFRVFDFDQIKRCKAVTYHFAAYVQARGWRTSWVYRTQTIAR
ncbi:hypothetical protein [Nostoc sp. NIES-3756]|uniref:hypothetical protein n=1 Tax=Nostoc sp. NIES-3756 TaxID=1751286 RepID=UPI0011DF83D6|nr:hypothetical protein [Nostoc sp. NIES-3756]